MSQTALAVERVFREESGRVIAGLIRLTRAGASRHGEDPFQVAEDLFQEALTRALDRWPVEGVPDNPAAWITRVARNAAIDRMRRWSSRERSLAELRDASSEPPQPVEADASDVDVFPDDRLRLFFTCCHPALPQPASVALTLRTLGGLTTAEIAKAFLVSEATLAQRLVRAKRKIAEAGIPYRVPPAELLPERLKAVLSVVYLIFNEGYLATSGDQLMRGQLCEEALRLGSVLVELLEGGSVGDSAHESRRHRAEALGLVALMRLTHARRAARVDSSGSLVRLNAQDRSRWDGIAIQRGLEELDRALSLRAAGPYQIQAAIAALHVRASTPDETDWPQIAGLYAALLHFARDGATEQATPIIELNRAVAIWKADGPERALPLVQRLADSGRLANYHMLYATLGHLTRALGRLDDAKEAFERALELTDNSSERRFLEGQIMELTNGVAGGEP
ncbi:MAG: RNA polymerase sigma factor [Polyangiaceae bacterium]